MEKQQTTVCVTESRNASYDATIVQQLAERQHIRQVIERQKGEDR